MKIKLEKGSILPTRSYPTDAGLDLYARKGAVIAPRNFCVSNMNTGHISFMPIGVVFDTGVHIQLEPGTFGTITGRSGLNMNHSIICPGGTIDASFRGSIKVKLYNLGETPYEVKSGDRIAQLVIKKCEYPELEVVDELDESDRSDNGFGSTGK